MEFLDDKNIDCLTIFRADTRQVVSVEPAVVPGDSRLGDLAQHFVNELETEPSCDRSRGTGRQTQLVHASSARVGLQKVRRGAGYQGATEASQLRQVQPGHHG